MPQPTIRFDFSYYIPNLSPGSFFVPLTEGQCIDKDFVIAVEAGELIPGNKYLIEYKLLNPQTNPGNPEDIFNPATQTIYASFTSQKFSTVADLKTQGEYILQVDITDISAGLNSTLKASAITNLKCGERPLPSVTPTLTPTITPSSFYREMLFSVDIPNPTIGSNDPGVINIYDCNIEFPLVAFVNQAIVGAQYQYSFYDNPKGAVYFENKTGEFYAGSDRQNFNTKIALTGYPYVWIYADVKHVKSGFTKSTEPILFKCYQTNECSVILPSGINIEYGANTLKTCAALGITNDSIKNLNGGTNFQVGDRIELDGTGAYPPPVIEISRIGLDESSFRTFGGGSGICIGDKFSAGSGSLFEISSGGLTNASILSFNNCYGFSVGDLVTTSGGGGIDAVISITATGTNGSIAGWNVLNPGHGYVGLPSNIIPINGPPNCGCGSVTFKTCEFTVPDAGGITKESIDVYGGNGYKCGDILNLEGGFPPAKLLVDSWSLTPQSIAGIYGGNCYNVGDYLTTVGGGGEDVLIRVSQVNTSGSITAWELLHGGHGFCSSPTGLINLSEHSCNNAQIAVLPGGNSSGISNDSVRQISGGTNIRAGDILVLEGTSGSPPPTVRVTHVGLDSSSLEYLSGGNGLNIGDYLTAGHGSLLEVVSGSLTKASISQLSSCSGFIVGDLLTTVGGGGKDSVIRVTSTSNGAIVDFEVLNSGYGFTSAPTGIQNIKSSGNCSTVVFNANNFTIPTLNGLTEDAISIHGGTGYNIGEVLNLVSNPPSVYGGSLTTDSIISLFGGANYAVGDYVSIVGCGGKDSVIKVTAASPAGEILGWELINGGYGYSSSDPYVDCVPFSVVSLTGNGIGAVVSTNNDNYAPVKDGAITSESIVGLIGSGTSFNKGDILVLTGGGGGGATILITKVGPTGQVLEYIILDSGAGYESSPSVSLANNILSPQPVFDETKFTEYSSDGSLTSLSINSITGGSGYVAGDYLTTSGCGGKDVLIKVLSVGTPTGNILTWELINGGYGFTCAPTSLVSLTGNGFGATISANNNNFTYTNYGSITKESVSGLIGTGTGYSVGSRIYLEGADGTGAIIEITRVGPNGRILDFVIINGGKNYEDDPLAFRSLTAIVPQPSFITSKFTDDNSASIQIISASLSSDSIDNIFGGSGYAVGNYLTTTGCGGKDALITVTSVGASGNITGWQLINGGYGFTCAPTGLVTLTGSGSGASISANANNFAITAEGGITKESISGLIGSGTGYAAGTRLLITDGNGSGAVIEITSVGSNGEILSYVVINSGMGYDSTPTVRNISGQAIASQPTFNISLFTDNGIIILDAGCCYNDSTSVSAVSINGDGREAQSSLDKDELIDSALRIINTGSVTVPPGFETLSIVTGDGSAPQSIISDIGTIPCNGGITYSSISGLIGKGSGYINNQLLSVSGGNGSGGVVQIIAVTGNGYISDFVVKTPGCFYGCSPAISLSTSTGSVISGVTLSCNNFTKIPVVVENPGWDVISVATGIRILTGEGSNVPSITIQTSGGLISRSGSIGGEITRKQGFTKDALPCFTGIVYRRSNGNILKNNDLIQLKSSTGSGATIVITDVDSSNRVLSWGIIDQGYGYSNENPVLLDDNNSPIAPQLSCYRPENLTDNSVIIINDGGGYSNPSSTNNRITSDTGSGSGAGINYDVDELTDLPINILNTGSTTVPPGFGTITRVTGSGSPPTGTFTSNGTIPCEGGITYEAVNNIIGNGPSHFVGQKFNINSAAGNGGVLEIIATSGNGYIRNYVITHAGCYYSCTSPISISPITGPALSNANIDCNDLTDEPFNIVDAGWGVISEATGITIRTGNGENTIDNIVILRTEGGWIPRGGPVPSPTPTPTVTPTVTPSLPAICNDIQSAGLQNEILAVKVGENAVAGSNYLIVNDNRSLLQYTVLSGNGIRIGTSITKIENWFSNYNNRVLYKKVTLDKPLVGNINEDAILQSSIVDMRYIKTQYWVGTMEFKFTSYSIPDRFRVIGVHADSRVGETILYDSGYRGEAERTPCGYITAADLSGPPSGSVRIVKPEGVIEIKVTVEAPCEGTAWQYLLGCPVRTDIFASPTPTNTLTVTPTPSRSRT